METYLISIAIYLKLKMSTKLMKSIYIYGTHVGQGSSNGANKLNMNIELVCLKIKI